MIYIDFWASWCDPCRKEMKKSKELHEKLKNQKITFVYISIDADKDKWVQAIKEENLMSNNMYLALNYPNAKFYTELNLKTIPRYMIFDNEGKLLLEDAPRPSETRLKEFIYDYLKLKK